MGTQNKILISTKQITIRVFNEFVMQVCQTFFCPNVFVYYLHTNEELYATAIMFYATQQSWNELRWILDMEEGRKCF